MAVKALLRIERPLLLPVTTDPPMRALAADRDAGSDYWRRSPPASGLTIAAQALVRVIF
jgi:hypothetical protein